MCMATVGVEALSQCFLRCQLTLRSCHVEQGSGLGIFHKLTFTLIGFDADRVTYQQLAGMIQDNGGMCHPVSDAHQTSSERFHETLRVAYEL